MWPIVVFALCFRLYPAVADFPYPGYETLQVIVDSIGSTIYYRFSAFCYAAEGALEDWR